MTWTYCVYWTRAELALTCYYGVCWRDHFAPPIGSGRGCGPCAGQYRLPFDVNVDEGEARPI